MSDRISLNGYEYGVATCREASCRARMVWAVNEQTGKGNPIDPEPVDDGNVVIVGQETTKSGPAPVVRYLAKGEDPGPVPRYKSHFATCPAADSFRKSAPRRSS